MSKIDHSLFSANKHALEKEYEICPQCGSELVIRNSKSGPFLGCASYPKCDFIRPLAHHDSNEIKILEDSACPECSKPLVVKNGRYGMFIGCTNFPECEHVEDTNQHDDIDVNCPSCTTGKLFEKTNRYGKTFYSCDQYPACKYVINYPPVNESCPECHWAVLVLRKMASSDVLICPQKKCSYKRKVE